MHDTPHEAGGSVVARTAKKLSHDVAHALANCLARDPANLWDTDHLLAQMPGGFQAQVNVQPAPAVAGDFASSNPRTFFDAGPGGLIAGPSGLAVGLFAWVTPPTDPDNTNTVANNFGGGNTAGFVHREQQGLITTFLADSSQAMQPGMSASLMTNGDVWVKNAGSSEALVGMKAYALFASGAVIFAAASATGSAIPNSASVTSGSASAIGTGAVAFSGSITGNIMTVTSVTGTLIPPGAYISGGTAGAVGTNTFVVSQLTGVTGSAGTYVVSVPEQLVGASTLSANWGILTVSGTVAGTFGLGDTIVTSVSAGTAPPTGTIISAVGSPFGTGTGGTGTYILSQIDVAFSSQTVNGVFNGITTGNMTALAAASAIETKWYAVSAGAAGELVKISSWTGSLG